MPNGGGLERHASTPSQLGPGNQFFSSQVVLHLFTYSPVDGYVNYFQFEAVIKKAAINVHK